MSGERGSGASAIAEAWRPVKGYEDTYLVSSFGRVRSLRKRTNDGIMVGSFDRGGYRRVHLSRDGKTKFTPVHRLVCFAFHGDPPEGFEVGHLDGSRDNNVMDNLKWVSRSENTRHSIAHGTFVGGIQFVKNRRGLPGHQNPNSRFTPAEIDEIRRRSAVGESGRAISRALDCAECTVRRIIQGVRYHG